MFWYTKFPKQSNILEASVCLSYMLLVHVFHNVSNFMPLPLRLLIATKVLLPLTSIISCFCELHEWVNYFLFLWIKCTGQLFLVSANYMDGCLLDVYFRAIIERPLMKLHSAGNPNTVFNSSDTIIFGRVV